MSALVSNIPALNVIKNWALSSVPPVRTATVPNVSHTSIEKEIGKNMKESSQTTVTLDFQTESHCTCAVNAHPKRS